MRRVSSIAFGDGSFSFSPAIDEFIDAINAFYAVSGAKRRGTAG
jgi:hypothetical protein